MAGMLNLEGHAAWIGYISVGDVDAHIEKIVEAGGKLLRPATDVPGMLRFAVVSDPQGAAFVAFTPNPAMPSPQRPAPPTPGTIGWHELYTTDLDGGFSFYNKLFGWSKVTDMDMGAMGLYRIFDEGDHKEMGDGGMMTKAPQMPVSCWNFYFHVDSIKAAIKRVESGGGKVVNGPMQVPGGAWIINGQDPQGAMFSLVSSAEVSRRRVTCPYGTITPPPSTFSFTACCVAICTFSCLISSRSRLNALIYTLATHTSANHAIM